MGLDFFVDIILSSFKSKIKNRSHYTQKNGM